MVFNLKKNKNEDSKALNADLFSSKCKLRHTEKINKKSAV